MIGSSDGACPGVVINADEDCIPVGWTDADLCPSLLVEEKPDEPDASVLEEVEVYSIQDAVVWMLGLDWDYLCIDRWNGEETYLFEDEVELKLKQALLDSVEVGEYRLSFAGYEFRNPFNAYDADKAKFPREAYYQWWKDCDHGLPCPAWFEDLRKTDEAAEVCEADIEVDNVPPPEELSPLKTEELPDIGCMEVVPGVAVSDLRAMLDCNSPMYCPRLLAAILTKIEIMPDEKKDKDGIVRLHPNKESLYNAEVKRKAMELLESLGVVSCTDKSRDPSPAKGDAIAVSRVLWRTLDGKNGRPKNL